VSGSAWAFDDTKRKRSRRIVKLQGFVLRALEVVKEKHEEEGEGNCCFAAELIFVTESCLPLTQRIVKREFRRLLAQAGSGPCASTICATPQQLWESRLGFPEGHLGSVGTCRHFIHAGALFARIAFDPGRGSGKGGKAARCVSLCLRRRGIS
jgi:hypothetical protein